MSTIHGAGEGLTTVDGMPITGEHTAAGLHVFQFNQLAVQEVTLATGGVTAESQAGGLNVNMVPKDGGNTLRGAFNGEFTNSSNLLRGARTKEGAIPATPPSTATKK